MKKKFIRNVSLVALSAVMLGGSAVAFAGCKGNSDYTLTASIFCDETDRKTNEEICNTWAASYTEKLRAEGVIDENTTIEVELTTESNTDTYFQLLRNDLAAGIAPDVFYVSPKYVKTWVKLGRILDLTEYLTESSDMLNDIWQDGLSFYAYSEDPEYTQGERIVYDATSSSFKTEAGGIGVGLYALPKDYSNFGLGVNNIYFSDALKEAYTTAKATDARNVKGAGGTAATCNYVGSDVGVVTYAVDGDGFSAGDDAPLINIGIPTTYKPYNFYAYSSYDEAFAAGDPMAKAVEQLTGGEGYTVTIPGWPGEKFDMPADSYAESDQYDASRGYITYTYAEFGAITWAVTYYLNTFAWDTRTTSNNTTQGGMQNASGEWKNVYGNDQYEGVLYLLPWLAGNDADYIDSTSTIVDNETGTDTTTSMGLNIKGEYVEEEIQYGVNSENFIETFAAFLAYGSDWNGNSYYAGDGMSATAGGWDGFCEGSVVFYGVGTWNGGSLNKTDRKFLEYKLIPEPVSEDFALYSKIKNADYELEEYGGECKEYTESDIIDNQVKRQDQWGARMDSVGYGVNAEVESYAGSAAEWKIEGAASLVQALTAQKEAQLTLTYSGAQLPNFVSQCIDYLYFQDEAHQDGQFKNMITPEGNAAGEDVWDEYYEIARDLVAHNNDTSTTLEKFMHDNYPNNVYDTTFADYTLNDIVDLAFAMKVLYMISYTYDDRNLSLRMQAGLNSVRDSAMYTYDDSWLDTFVASKNVYLLAYTGQVPISKDMDQVIVYSAGSIQSGQYYTPRAWCMDRVKPVAEELAKVIQQEQDDMS